MDEPVRALAVEDHPVYRQALAALIQDMEGWQVLGAYAAAEPAIARASEADVVVLDLGLPGIGGIEAAQVLRDKNPRLAILVLTMSHETPLLTAAVRAGARGYLVKGAEPQDIQEALRAVARGQVVFGEQVADAILEQAGRRTTVVADDLFPTLSRREVEVLDLVSAGRSNTQTATALFVSPKTARNHVSSILTKLGAPGLKPSPAHATPAWDAADRRPALHRSSSERGPCLIRGTARETGRRLTLDAVVDRGSP